MRNIFALAILAFAFQGCYLVKKQETYYGMAATGKNIVFVLDISGSMEGKNEGGIAGQVVARATDRGAGVVERTIGGRVGQVAGKQIRKQTTKLGAAKRELIPTIKGLLETTQFSILIFDDKVKSWRAAPVPANASNKNIATVYLDAVQSGGNTSAKKALETAFNIQGADTIFFVTDGQPTDASTQEILTLVAQKNRNKRIKVNCVGIGDDQDENFLRQLANQNGGTFFRK